VILVVGGTGLLGRHLVRRLLGRSAGVRVLTRDPDRARDLAVDGVEVVSGDLRDPASLEGAVAGVTVVVAAAHGVLGPRGESPATVDGVGNAQLIDAAAGVGADVVLVSIVGVAAEHPLELFRMKFMAEEHLRRSRVPGTVVRATAFAELWIRLLRETAGRGGRPLVFGRGESRTNFVSVVDVAALLEQVLADPGTRGEVLEIGGPDHLTVNELVALVQSADGRSGEAHHVPRPVVRLMANTVGLVSPQLRRQAQLALDLDGSDHVFDSREVRARFPGLPSTTVRDLLRQPPAATAADDTITAP
jgi:NADH dehydrogenase